jgi:hypothetical protein
MSARMFVGDLGGGDYRARISKEGFDAADPDLPGENLLFDSSWPFVGKIHVAGFLRYSVDANYPTGMEVSFPELPYIPAVFAADYSKLSGTQGGRPAIMMGDSSRWRSSVVVHNDRLVVDANDTGSGIGGGGLYYVVFRHPLVDVDTSEQVSPPVPRMLIGKRGADYGFYTSRPGYDVETCSDLQMLFSTDDPPDCDVYIGYRWESDDYGGLPDTLEETTAYTSQGFTPAIIGMGAVDGNETLVLPLWRMNESSGSGGPDGSGRIWWDDNEIIIVVSNLDVNDNSAGTIVVTNFPVTLPPNN